MARPAGMTEAQTQFLRSFHTNPLGPPAEQWPSPAVLRRWMRRGPFRIALQSVRDTLRFQADLHLASAAAQAASALQETVKNRVDGENDVAQLQAANARIGALVQLLRLSHLRTRYTVDPPVAPRDNFREEVVAMLSMPHPDLTVGRAMELIQDLLTEEEREDFRKRFRLRPRNPQVT